MILLDTNVLSELMRPAPAAPVVAWLDVQNQDEMWISAITQAEIRLGLALLPEGQRSRRLAFAAKVMFEEDFGERCLPFDAEAAEHYARIVAARSRQGRPISVEDAQVAAIALNHTLTLATRNGKDFALIEGLVVVDPWKS